MIYNILAEYAVPDLSLLGLFLDWLVKNIGNIGWAVVVFTLALKTVLLPLDYWSKASMKKNNLKMEKLRPQLERLKKQYSHDEALYNQKLQALYKKEGYSVMGSCLPMIITLLVFIFVFRAFNDYLSANILTVYNNMIEAYERVGAEAWATEALKYESQIAPSFLWIKNVWRPDVPWERALMSASNFMTQIGGQNVDAELYNTIMAPLTKDLNVVNGYLLLPILSAGSSLLLQFITSKTQKTQMELQGGSAAASNKMMMIMMPAMMGFFAIGWTSIFAIYLVTSSVYSILTTVVVNKIVDVRFAKEEQEIAMQKARR
ncbi:MAG: membrane protein insertase YidC [Clostridia bacterium]|nr:membrane protein insertase YidC [Clostridia bacterium]